MSQGFPGPLIAIVGPTASGKSALAERVAMGLSTSVVSIDAMQVYRGMDIGTAKVPVKDRVRPLLMVDVADIDEEYSVKLFQRDCRIVVNELLQKGLVPVLCGGTGLYLNAVIDDMQFPAGSTVSPIRSKYERMRDEQGSDALYQLLLQRDEASAREIHPNNVRRVIRALEMLDEGVSYAKHHEGLSKRLPVYDTRIWGIQCDRDLLYARIDKRVDKMFEAGLVEEVMRLRAMGLAQARTASQAIGYKEILEALDGRADLETARQNIKTRTRHYAKRQLSWFKHDQRVRWIDVQDIDGAAAQIIADLADYTVN